MSRLYGTLAYCCGCLEPVLLCLSVLVAPENVARADFPGNCAQWPDRSCVTPGAPCLISGAKGDCTDQFFPVGCNCITGVP
jgi:hypothetical protein